MKWIVSALVAILASSTAVSAATSVSVVPTRFDLTNEVKPEDSAIGTVKLAGGNSTVNLTAPKITASSPVVVPEPATWAMVLVGFGLVSATVRYRRRKSTFTDA